MDQGNEVDCLATLMPGFELTIVNLKPDHSAWFYVFLSPHIYIKLQEYDGLNQCWRLAEEYSKVQELIESMI